MSIKSNQNQTINLLNKILIEIKQYNKIEKNTLLHSNISDRLNKTLMQYNKELNICADNLLDQDNINYELKLIRKLNGEL